ncbi:MAG TPA: tyrosine-type recombinase/integrase [Patescibacteria group bacterium]|nr:tyrosine-type recombinase/integrase [Patescibacteria group bacterium]
MSDYLNKDFFTTDEYIVLCSFFVSHFRYKPKSEKNYAYDFNIFRKYIDKSMFKVDPALCDDFIRNTDKAYPSRQAPATIERIYSQLHRLYEYFKEQNKVAENPFNAVEKPSIERSIRQDKVLSFEEAESLLNAAKELNLRDYAMLQVLFTTGLKMKDFIALNWNSIIADLNGELGIYIQKHNKPYYNKLHEDVVETLLQYRELLGKEQSISANESEAIFVNAKGERISQNWVRMVIKDACKKAGIKALSPSSIRNSLGAFMLTFGAAPEEVAQIMGYSDTFLTTRLPIVLPKRTDYIHFNIKGIHKQL